MSAYSKLVCPSCLTYSIIVGDVEPLQEVGVAGVQEISSTPWKFRFKIGCKLCV
jgi:hypothetical protein